MEACPSSPHFNKSLEEGQGIPPGSSYTSASSPPALSSLLGQARESCREPGLGRRWSGSPALPSPAASPSFIQTRKQGLLPVGIAPQPVIQVPGEECLDPPATLWSEVPKNC